MPVVLCCTNTHFMKKYIMLLGMIGWGTVFAQVPTALTQLQQDNVAIQIWEEKLARDIYLLANTRYAHPVFEHKIRAEESHRDLLNGLLPAQADIPTAYGECTDPAWNARFLELKEQASGSFTEALKAGAFIEEQDIAGLEQGSSLMTDSAAIQVYRVLIEASEHHLRSFLKQLEMQGIAYTPQVLSPDRITAIQSGTGCGAGRQADNACGRNCGKSGC